MLEQLSTSVSDLQSDVNTLKRGSCNEGLNEPGPSNKKARHGVSASEHCNDEGDDDDSSGIDEFL